MSTDQELLAVPVAVLGRLTSGRSAITAAARLGPNDGRGKMRFELICPSTTVPWDTPANAGFDRAAMVARLDGLGGDGHDYELVDGDALSDQERSGLYGQALSALARAGNRYSIRQVFGSRRRGGGDQLGSGIPALLVFEDGEPVDVYPHQVGGGYETIRAYLNAC